MQLPRERWMTKFTFTEVKWQSAILLTLSECCKFLSLELEILSLLLTWSPTLMHGYFMSQYHAHRIHKDVIFEKQISKQHQLKHAKMHKTWPIQNIVMSSNHVTYLKQKSHTHPQGLLKVVLIVMWCWEFWSGPINIGVFEEKVTHSYTNRPDFGPNFDHVSHHGPNMLRCRYFKAWSIQ